MSRGIFTGRLEVEVALLAGILGFFLGGIVNVRKEILDIAVGAVVTGAIVFFMAYYAVLLVFSGRDPHNDAASAPATAKPIDPAGPARRNPGKPAVKGTKIDLKTPGDDLFDDIYGK